MGRVKNWMMEMEEAEMDRLLSENPDMTFEEAHKIVRHNPYESEE